jgi:prepilin-type N-terminal cleavage/methylation domain-containing protein/prepilin-type processing-associated H-X9-DG protein
MKTSCIPYPSPEPKKSRGFTLVELLVVIIMVAVLAVIAFTYARKGIASADRAACLGIMRQYGSATAAYIADHNGSFPGPIKANGQTANYVTGGGNFFSHIHPYLGLPETSKLTGFPDNMCCPAFQRQFPAWNAKGDGGTIRPYIMNQDQRINGKRVFGPQDSRDKETATMRYVNVVEGTGKTHLAQLPLISDGSTDASQPHAHGNVRNILFMDFHAETKPLSYPVNALK